MTGAPTMMDPEDLALHRADDGRYLIVGTDPAGGEPDRILASFGGPDAGRLADQAGLLGRADPELERVYLLGLCHGLGCRRITAAAR